MFKTTKQKCNHGCSLAALEHNCQETELVHLHNCKHSETKEE